MPNYDDGSGIDDAPLTGIPIQRRRATRRVPAGVIP